MIALNKIDVEGARETATAIAPKLAASAGHKRIIAISAASRENVPKLMERLRSVLASAKLPGAPTQAEPVLELDADSEADSCQVTAVQPGTWWVTGEKIEKAASMTNWDYGEAQERFQRIMQALGVSKKLKEQGARNGDTIMVADVDFVYYEESAMAVRARLAGFMDEEEADEADEWLSDEELEERRKDLAALRQLMEDDGGEVTRY